MHTYQAKWCIRDKSYKLIVSRRRKDIHGLSPVELYNFKKDPKEQQNIAFLKPEITERYKEKLEKWISKKLRENNLKTDPLKKTITPFGKTGVVSPGKKTLKN